MAALASSSASSPSVSSDSFRDDVARDVRMHLEQLGLEGVLEVTDESLLATQALPAFYEQRLYQPAWVDGADWTAANDLVAALEDAAGHGLRAEDYHLAVILRVRKLAQLQPSAGILGDLDILLTDAFLIYGAHLVSGRVDPATFDPEWTAMRREADLVALATRAAATGKPREALRELLPTAPGYDRLRGALAQLRLAEDWPVPSLGESLVPGDIDPRVVELRQRLASDLPTAGGDLSPVYDADLEAAVRRFQARHGLGNDGVVGKKTLEAMRVTREERVVQLEMNLERWRWLPRQLGERYLLVNIPEFVLRVREAGEVVLEMAAVVGRDSRRTPVMSDEIRYLVLNPFWDVPPTLAVEDKLPEIVKDTAYLTRNGFRVLQGWGSEEREIDPATVSWADLKRSRFPYRLRQDPGPLNALGRIKFMFPNPHNVYIHDTPAREVFAKPERAASSGCIRVERPLDLAEFLMRDTPWTRQKLQAAIDERTTQTVALPEKIPVHLEYWTAWVTVDGEVHYRADIYGRDAALAAVLARPAPQAATP